MNDLARRRAEQASDSKLWSPTDALELILSDIKEGKISPDGLAIHYWKRNPNGSRTMNHCVAGLDFPEHITLLTVALSRVVEDYKG